jgi:RND superfamily putative drug exporter
VRLGELRGSVPASVLDLFARAIVAARLPIVVGWVSIAVVLALALPTLKEAQTGALAELVPADSQALEAELLSSELFAFPLASRTLVVQRDPDGLGPERVVLAARRILQTNQGTLVTEREPDGAYGITNAVPGLSFAREQGTTAVTALLFGGEFNQRERVDAARAYVETLDVPNDEFVGITGVIPGRAAQAELIADNLPRMELATLAVVSLTVALYLRSVVAPLVTLLTVAVAYLVSIRVVAVVGQEVGIGIPPEVEPIIVALLFGVVTDYGLFYMSRFRRRLDDGDSASDAARGTTAELTPIILACGLAVAAGAGVLVFADLGFLRAFGPGLALAVLVGLLVTLTLLPAALALFGRRLFWPSSPRRPSRRPSKPPRAGRVIVRAVRAPRRTIAASLIVLASMASGLAWLDVGNPVIRGLPAGSEPRQAYGQLTAGFAPGVAGPTTVIVTAPGITGRRDELASLQTVLANQPGVAGVLGPGTSPADEPFGVVLSPTGDAARFVLIPDDDPLGARAVRLIGNLRARTPDLVDAVGLEEARVLYAGDTTIVGEIIDTANDDLVRVAPLVLLAVGLVLAVFLRALVAPVYLVLLAALGPLAALGLAVGLFQGVLGHPELTYFVPLAAGVLLVALGSDYNIFLVGRIWSEARGRPLREAIIVAGSGASHAISAAGLVLAASFAALALVPVRAFQELAFVLAAGLLIDAFLVRSVLAPAVIALVGERSGWPGRRLGGLDAAAQDALAPPAAPDPASGDHRGPPPGALGRVAAGALGRVAAGALVADVLRRRLRP